MGETLERPQAPSRHRLDVDAYYKMAEAGILTRADRVELIDGEIIDMNAIGSPHAGKTNRLARLFARTGGRWPRPRRASRARFASMLTTNSNPISCCCGPAPTIIRQVIPAPPTSSSSLKCPTARSLMTAAQARALREIQGARGLDHRHRGLRRRNLSRAEGGRLFLDGAPDQRHRSRRSLVPGVTIDVAALLA